MVNNIYIQYISQFSNLPEITLVMYIFIFLQLANVETFYTIKDIILKKEKQLNIYSYYSWLIIYRTFL